MLYVPLGKESLIVPVNFDPDCVQRRVKVPVYPPLYCPDQVPESAVLVIGFFCFAQLLPAPTISTAAAATASVSRASLRRSEIICFALLAVVVIAVRDT